MNYAKLVLLVLISGISVSCHKAVAPSDGAQNDTAPDSTATEDTEAGTGAGEDTATSSDSQINTDPENETETDIPEITTDDDTGSDIFDDTESPDTMEPGPRASDKPKSLVIIVDDSKSMTDGTLDTLYTQFPNEIGGVLAELYEQPLEEITSRTLSEIAEDFGEDWIIDNIQMAAGGHYEDIITMTDDEATLDALLSSVRKLSNLGHLVDIVMVLHGTTSGDILFFDDTYPVEYLTENIESEGLTVSAIYQTQCYGSDMLDEWANMGIHAANGSVGDNIYINFAPGAFLRHWTSGYTYADAVQQARIDDLTEMKTRLGVAASNNVQLRLLLSLYDFEAQSLQLVAGEYPETYW